MRRIGAWLLSTVAVVVLLFSYHTSTSGALTAGQETVVPGTPDPGTYRSWGRSGSATGPGTSRAGTPGRAEGTVTGPVIQTQWGPVQVQLTTRAGTITDVRVLQYPDSNSQDQQINTYALPVLVQATLEAQSADIDMVSGATYTSYGYLQSLQAALDEARL